jgi:hypothetical protein
MVCANGVCVCVCVRVCLCACVFVCVCVCVLRVSAGLASSWTVLIMQVRSLVAIVCSCLLFVNLCERRRPGFFVMTFYTQNDHFTKAGSGQTHRETLKKNTHRLLS